MMQAVMCKSGVVSALLDRSVFQLLKTQVMAKKPHEVEGNMGEF